MLISIITPTLLRRTTERCLASVKAQTFQDYEHLVFVDGLKTTWDNYLRDFAAFNPKIKPDFAVTSYRNFGNTPRHLLAKQAKGDYVIYLDDDVYFKNENSLQILSEFLGEADWGVYGIEYKGQSQFLNYPANCATDINQVFHKRVINGVQVFFPDRDEQNTDGIFVENLLKMSPPLIVRATQDISIYEKMNYGKQEI